MSGDGCSAECQRECTSSTDCPSTDPCTPGACTGGIRTTAPLAAFAGAICKACQLIQLPECTNDNLAAKLALPGKVKKIQALRHRASMVTKRANFVLQSRRVLAYLGTRNARLASKGKISADCASSLEQHFAELTSWSPPSASQSSRVSACRAGFASRGTTLARDPDAPLSPPVPRPEMSRVARSLDPVVAAPVGVPA